MWLSHCILNCQYHKYLVEHKLTVKVKLIIQCVNIFSPQYWIRALFPVSHVQILNLD